MSAYRRKVGRYLIKEGKGKGRREGNKNRIIEVKEGRTECISRE